MLYQPLIFLIIDLSIKRNVFVEYYIPCYRGFNILYILVTFILLKGIGLNISIINYLFILKY